MNPLPELARPIAALLLYQDIFATSAGHAFVQLLERVRSHIPTSPPEPILQAYGQWFQAMATQRQSWQTFLVTQILQADNPFSHQAQSQAPLAPSLCEAAQHDLQILQQLHQITGADLAHSVTTITGQTVPPWQPDESTIPFNHPLKTPDWADSLSTLIQHYQHNSTGIFTQFRAFRWQAGQLVGIPYPDPVQLDSLVSYEYQRDLLIKNTEFLLAGYPALHVLLYGSRGSGKSSLIKGLLNHYADRPLRLIEVSKSDLQDLSAIAEQLRPLPLKFILFVDDLSFEEDDEAFKALKVVLEGNVTARPQNLVVYATSNRRHLIREFHGDRPRPKDGDEIFAWDTVQEKLSFSDRFGLTLTFEPANQDMYLVMVHHLAQQAQLSITTADLEFQALQWATRHNGRSGRTARQFIDFLTAELALQS